jgi:hypothetical protein
MRGLRIVAVAFCPKRRPGGPFVSVMKPTDVRHGNDLAELWRLHNPRLRRVLGQRGVRPGLVTIGHERFQVAMQAGLVENDYVVEALAANFPLSVVHQ